jgi:starvation-inducible outer membrane lipoprotein
LFACLPSTGDFLMSTFLRAALAVAFAASLAACASQPQGIDLNAPQPKRVDAKTSLENSQKY